MTGRLGGIARRNKPRAAMETVPNASVTRAAGVEGDCRGRPVAGKLPRRQVSLIEAESWHAAMAELGDTIGWHERRANLLIEGLRLPREAGTVIAIGSTLRIETTMECDPCSRMDELRPGLRNALTPDWRGGILGMVIADGDIAVGDEVRIVA